MYKYGLIASLELGKYYLEVVLPPIYISEEEADSQDFVFILRKDGVHYYKKAKVEEDVFPLQVEFFPTEEEKLGVIWNGEIMWYRIFIATKVGNRCHFAMEDYQDVYKSLKELWEEEKRDIPMDFVASNIYLKKQIF